MIKKISVSIYLLPNDFRSMLNQVSTYFFKFMSGYLSKFTKSTKTSKNDVESIEYNFNGVLEPRYFPVNGRDVPGKINKHLL